MGVEIGVICVEGTGGDNVVFLDLSLWKRKGSMV